MARIVEGVLVFMQGYNRAEDQGLEARPGVYIGMIFEFFNNTVRHPWFRTAPTVQPAELIKFPGSLGHPLAA